VSAPKPAPFGGDPSKPGAWTPEQIAAANLIHDCDHGAFWATNPSRYDDVCPACKGIVRLVPTSPEGWADHWAEERADDRAQEGLR
jgi:hypothetical protein